LRKIIWARRTKIKKEFQRSKTQIERGQSRIILKRMRIAK